MQQTNEYTMPSMLARLLLTKYDSQNARYPVEYVEAEIDEEGKVGFLGPRTLKMTMSGEEYRGLWIRFKDEPEVHLISFLRITKFHKDFCRIAVVWYDDREYTAEYIPYIRD